MESEEEGADGDTERERGGGTGCLDDTGSQHQWTSDINNVGISSWGL